MRVPNKHIIYTFFGLLLATALLLQGAPRAFASTRRATTFLPNLAQTTLAIPRRHWLLRPLHFRRQEDNQAFQACVFNTTNKYYLGYNQGNSGNHGVNSGYTEDDSVNQTNQIIIRSAFGHRRINQSFQICATDSANLHYFGAVQGNSGNSGFNAGQNEDNSSNIGNQIVG